MVVVVVEVARLLRRRQAVACAERSLKPAPHLCARPAAGFPFVLLMILVCGAELFTGNTAMLPAAVYEGKATVPQLLKNWCAVGRPWRDEGQGLAAMHRQSYAA